jgi:hypothetical protein
MNNYLAILSDIPSKHSGLIFEQISRAAGVAAFMMRAHGLALPGETKIPTFPEVQKYLQDTVNRALDVYFSTKEQAPRSTAANEIWGEDGDMLFSVVVTGISKDEEEGFTAEIDMNLLYGGSDGL